MGLLKKSMKLNKIKVNDMEMARLINEHFIKGADGMKMKDVQKCVKGGLLFAREILSDDEDFRLYCSNADVGRLIFIKQISSNTVYEHRYLLGHGKLKKMVKEFCRQEIMNGSSKADLSVLDNDDKEPVPVIDRNEELIKMKSLLDDGILTEKEFEKEKKKLLG